MSRRNLNSGIPVRRPSSRQAYPSRGDFGDGSMLVGPNDPRWFGGVGEDPGFPGVQLSVPPGARFDPYGPPGVPGFEPYRYLRAPRRSGSGTHPDLEHFGNDSEDVLGFRELGYWRNFRYVRIVEFTLDN